MKTIPLTQGQVAFVDDADFESVSQFKWFAQKRDRRFYAARSIRKPDGKWAAQYLHRFLMPGIPRVDHEDGNGLNNQRYNLRPATNQQNMRGFRRKKISATSNFRGVTWHKPRRKWQARIKVAGKDLHLGLFTSEIEAARAYDSAAVFYFGEYASPNFIIGEIRITR